MADKKTIPAFLAFFAALAALSAPVLAQEPGYDPYAPVYPEAQTQESAAGRAAANLLVLPFEIIRWPVSKSLVFVEKNHIDKKIQYVYDNLQNAGIHPELNFVGTGSYGVDVDWIRFAKMKNRFPDVRTRSWIYYANNVYFNVGAEAGWQDLTRTGLGVTGLVNYESRPEEPFYGLGPDSSAGDGTSFKMETTQLGVKLSHNPNPVYNSELLFSYRNINITNGEDGGRGIIDRIFPAGSIPGLGGDEILTMGGQFIHDTRNHRDLSSAGGMQRVGFSYNEGVNGSDARYFKYEAEASHYFSLGSERRVLAIHGFAEHNDEINGGYVPFHQMARLGGFYSRGHPSQSLRGYDYNRFFGESAVLFNIEYRYAIWEYRDFRMDTVLFWDEGQVFEELSDFKFSDFRESYGIGFRVSVANHMLVGVELAHGDEGTNVYVKTKTAF